MAEEVKMRPFSRDWGHRARLIRNAHQRDAVERRDHETLHCFLCDYWRAPVSAEFFDGDFQRFEDIFLQYHLGLVDAMKEAISKFEDGEVRLVELGSGDGQVLQYLGEKLSGVGTFIGIDLNENQVIECREKYRDEPKLRFENYDVSEWLREHPSKRTVFFTNGGVLEYFTRAQLLDLFGLLHASGPCVVAITETLAVDHDLESESETFPYGHELAFSHNYPAILREAGFEPGFRNDRFTKEGEEHHPSRWYQLLAVGG